MQVGVQGSAEAVRCGSTGLLQAAGRPLAPGRPSLLRDRYPAVGPDAGPCSNHCKFIEIKINYFELIEINRAFMLRFQIAASTPMLKSKSEIAPRSWISAAESIREQAIGQGQCLHG